MKSLSVKRFVRKCGVITQEQEEEIVRAIMLTIGFDLEMIEKMF